MKLKIIDDAKDAFIIAGISLLAYGLHMIYAPLMYIVLGIGFIIMGLPRKAVK